MKNKLTIQIWSDESYDHLIAEIYCDDKFVALIHQENGPDRLGIVFPTPELNQKAVLYEVELNWFKDAIEKATKKLLQK